MKKKWLSLFAVAFLAFGGLSACAGDDESDTEDQTEETTTDTTEEDAE
ncbi:hypothetical protein SAMN04487943_102167 [Gracilibacillus orientalis]|uniref:Uncharacterized protein n=1 Tax=Gracilibacillus orientalis TaxID=334253 RepID=A0A1I4IKM6_9BACI|nr:hypothetical protein [Gracilibacillus orientalis]SFL54922.1 hypothetical protein SAMN04487943_102167 [Gracilibacillus orientalis]